MKKSKRLFTGMLDNTRRFPTVRLLILFSCLQASTTALATQPHTDINGPFATPAEVNTQCVACHEVQAEDLRKSNHWNWERNRVIDNKTVFSKKMTDLSRFGIAAVVNPKLCRSCHISTLPQTLFDETGLSKDLNCLICHDTTGTYQAVGQGADLEHIARTVGKPLPRNCRSCHDRQCGLSPETALQPDKDVHLQQYGFTCQQCHPGGGHHIFKRTINSSTAPTENKGCASCHTQAPHSLSRLNQHAVLIACQSCHIPTYGNNGTVLVSWNWLLSDSKTSTYQQKDDLFAAQGFFLGKDILPHYSWDNGSDVVYTRGTKIRPEQTTVLQVPGPRSPASKIMPFSIQYGTQPYDTKFRYLISPKLPREKAPFFNGTDWNTIITQGMNKIRLPYSGQYGFTTTVSFRRLNHGVVPADEALDCMDCHGTTTRFNWQQLGYEQDPWTTGSKNMKTPVPKGSLPTIELPPIRETILPVVPPT